MSFILHNNKNNFKNDILVLAVVGATFAYFTATTATEGTGNTATVKTTDLKGAKLTFTNATEVLNMLDYPGGLGIYGATAKIEKEEAGSDTNNYKATFDLEITYTNQTGTDLEWELWMMPKEIKDLDFEEHGGIEAVTTCERKSESVEGNTYFWYADKDDHGTYTEQDRCDAKAIQEAVKSNEGQLIAYGKLPSKSLEQDQKITKSTTKEDGDGAIQYEETEETLQSDPLKEQKVAIKANQLGERELSTKEELSSKVYYLVVKYPNENSNQSSDDAGKDIKVNLNVAEGSKFVVDQAE